MRDLIFYRGIAVPSSSASEVTHRILQNGMVGNEGRWEIPLPNIQDVRSRIDQLFARTDLTRDDLGQLNSAALCACGTSAGGAYYALRHNHSSANDAGLLIEFTAPVEEVVVDPKDFLCTAFQLWDQQAKKNVNNQRSWLRDVYGKSILRYFDACVGSTDQTLRIAMCNLAAADENVVLDHHANRNVIAGRHGTRFASAFFIKAPIPATRILHVDAPTDYIDPNPDVTLNEFLGRPMS